MTETGKGTRVPARDSENWTRVCSLAEVDPGEARTLDVDPPVAVWNVDGDLFATDDTCTHEKYSLADGYIDGCQVECALHWAKFDVRTGEALSLPASVGLRTYPVKIEADEVFVDLSRRG
jgi:3-phenylpropionate/trans-cinnamate dioxygenase ferredoxin subunit